MNESKPHAPAIQSAIPEDELARLTDDIVTALKSVYDPEIPADIYELGLIYKVDIADDRSVVVDMTLTSPNSSGKPNWTPGSSPAAGAGPLRPNAITSVRWRPTPADTASPVRSPAEWVDRSAPSGRPAPV